MKAYNYKSLLPEGRRCRANNETDEGERSALRMLESVASQKPSPRRGRWAASAARIRCSRRSGVIFYIVMITTTAWSTTSAPPTAEPLLKEKPFGGRSIQRSQIATNDKCTQPSPRGTPILIGVGWRSQAKEEIFKGTDGACADPGTRIFPAT